MVASSMSMILDLSAELLMPLLGALDDFFDDDNDRNLILAIQPSTACTGTS